MSICCFVSFCVFCVQMPSRVFAFAMKNHWERVLVIVLSQCLQRYVLVVHVSRVMTMSVCSTACRVYPNVQRMCVAPLCVEVECFSHLCRGGALHSARTQLALLCTFTYVG